jgi:hypothetical protein
MLYTLDAVCAKNKKLRFSAYTFFLEFLELVYMISITEMNLNLRQVYRKPPKLAKTSNMIEFLTKTISMQHNFQVSIVSYKKDLMNHTYRTTNSVEAYHDALYRLITPRKI